MTVFVSPTTATTTSVPSEETPMAMVGLFWITEGCVYLGAKPPVRGPVCG